MPNNTIHYLWIGPPTLTNPNSIAGHDIAGPVEMAKELQNQGMTNPIKFWCLREYRNGYQQQFATEGVNIEVCAVEDLIDNDLKSVDLAKHAEFVNEQLLSLKLSKEQKTWERVKFKDIFSLYLMTSQGGYCLDTNVFPRKKDFKINLNGELTSATGRSFEGMHDFFLMYSLGRNDPNMLEAFETWKKSPGFGRITVFDDDSFVFLEYRDMGLQKLSYKSYSPHEKLKGLFYWLHPTATELEKNLRYGDINQQITNLESARLINSLSLIYRDENIPPKPEDLPLDVSEAFVGVARTKIYYVNKEKKLSVCIHSGYSSFFDIFWMGGDQRKSVTPRDLFTIFQIIEQCPNKEHCPAYIINVADCTLLHHLVLTNDIQRIRILLDAGARFDLKATYKVMPAGETLLVTPKELANYLGHKEASDLLHEKELLSEKIEAARVGSTAFFQESKTASQSEQAEALHTVKGPASPKK